jgi:uncharacterized protein YukE
VTLVAGASLGSTDDPTALVVGSVETVETIATRFSDTASDVDARRTALSRVRAASWTGVAADAWETRMDEELTRFTRLVEVLETAATAFTGYAGALRTAQDRAREAIETWDRGEQATETATQAFNRDVDAYNEAIRSGGPLPPHPGTFVDPGQDLRDEAEEILSDARDTLDSAGTDAVRSLGGLPGSRTEGSSSWFGAEGEVSGPTFTWDAFSQAFGDRRTGDYRDGEHSDAGLSFGSASGDAWVYRAQGGWEDYIAGGRATADGEFRFLTADGSAGGSLTPEGLRLNADGTLTLVGASGEFEHAWEYGHYGASAEGSVEASAEGHADVGATGVHVGGEVFAGARIAGDLEGGLFGITARGTAEGWAGAGAGADGVLGYDDGVFRLSGSGGAAWGLGGKLGLDLEVDVPELVESLDSGVTALTELFP